MQDEAPIGPNGTPRWRTKSRSAACGLRSVSFVLGCIALLEPASMASSEARMDPPRSFVRLLDGDGSWSAGRVVGLDPTHWTIESRITPARPESGSVVRIERSRIVAGIVQRLSIEPYPASHFDPWGPVPPYVEPLSSAMLELVDGQRLPGTYQVGPEGAAWDHRWIGVFPIVTDRIASIRFLPSTVIRRPSDSDLVVLSNGDRINGFIEALGTEIVLDAAGSPGASNPGEVVDAGSDDGGARDPSKDDSPRGSSVRRIPVDRVAAVAFAAIESAETPPLLVWTMDGSVVGARELAFDDASGWSFSLTDRVLAGVRQRSTADNMAADPVGFVCDTGRFVPLATLGRPRIGKPEGAVHHGLADACRIGPMEQVSLGLASVELAGPVIAEFRRSDAASVAKVRPFVFSALVRLAEPAPLDAAVEVTVDLGAGAMRRFRLDAATPVERLTIVGAPVGAPQVTITLDDAGNGPIGDRVVFERAVFVQGSAD